MEAVVRAIEMYLEYFEGNQTKAAKELGVMQGHIWYWLNKTDLPIELIKDASIIIGKKPSEMRPDLAELFKN